MILFLKICISIIGAIITASVLLFFIALIVSSSSTITGEINEGTKRKRNMYYQGQLDYVERFVQIYPNLFGSEEKTDIELMSHIKELPFDNIKK